MYRIHFFVVRGRLLFTVFRQGVRTSWNTLGNNFGVDKTAFFAVLSPTTHAVKCDGWIWHGHMEFGAHSLSCWLQCYNIMPRNSKPEYFIGHHFGAGIFSAKLCTCKGCLKCTYHFDWTVQSALSGSKLSITMYTSVRPLHRLDVMFCYRPSGVKSNNDHRVSIYCNSFTHGLPYIVYWAVHCWIYVRSYD